MSYCRFENTLADLKDCEEALANNEARDLNEYEYPAALELLAVCARIAKSYSERDIKREE
jgi:hypothetical protein